MGLSVFRKLPPFEVVRTAEHALLTIDALSGKNAPDILAVDTETTGLVRHRDYAVILSLSDGKRRWAVMPEVIHMFKELLENPKQRLAMHNANFDAWMLHNIGIDIDRNMARDQFRVYDTMVMHALIDDQLPHDLKFLARTLMNVEMVPFKELYGAELKKRTLLEIFTDTSWEKVNAHYASLDAYVTHGIFYKLHKQLCGLRMPEGRAFKSMWEYFRDIEVPYTRILWNMERRGLPLNTDNLLARAPDMELEMMQIHNWFCRELRSWDVNLKSNPQMCELFFGKLQREPITFTEGGSPQLSKVTLKTWATRDKCEFAQKLLKYRDLQKKLDTYVLGLLKDVGADGRIHTTLVQTGARTGRLASREPNLQNQPEYIRDAYEAEDERVLLARDYAQLEMRITAHMSGDPTLIDAINTGKDVHCATAANMYGKDYDLIFAAKCRDDRGEPLSAEDKELLKLRKGAKTLNFGILYGMGPAKLARDLGVSLAEAKDTLERYFAAMPGVKDYFERAIAAAKTNGYCETILGRRKQVPDIWAAFSGLASRAIRQVKNMPIQGTAAEIAKRAQIAIWLDPVLLSRDCHMVLQIHDEILFDVPVMDEALMRDTSDRVARHMSAGLGVPFRVPLDTSGKYGKTWRDCK